MSSLTESEILSVMKEHAARAASDCRNLAILPVRGPTYTRMRESLRTLEDCCRQMAFWREDGRWIPLSLEFETAHQLSMNWLRSHAPRYLFEKLAEKLDLMVKGCVALETQATGRVGMILPKAGPAPHRDTRPVQVLSSGLILPAGHA